MCSFQPGERVVLFQAHQGRRSDFNADNVEVTDIDEDSTLTYGTMEFYVIYHD